MQSVLDYKYWIDWVYWHFYFSELLKLSDEFEPEKNVMFIKKKNGPFTTDNAGRFYKTFLKNAFATFWAKSICFKIELFPID